MPILYLIPCPIAETALETIPEYVIQHTRQVDYFVVERFKTARHYVKSIQHPKPISDLFFEELSQNEDATAAFAFFDKAIAQGKDVGLLSEAGCPGVADPGAALVRYAHEKGIQVEPLVGPSSLLLALMASGMNGQKFAFHGYLSAKRPELARELKKIEQDSIRLKQTQMFIETPYRSQMVLEVALEALLPQTLFGVSQNLTHPEALVKTMTVAKWKKIPNFTLDKLPAVFLIGN